MSDLVPVVAHPGSQREAELTPREIVRELDKYIIGQANAKRAVAVALRNRYRRSMLPRNMSRPSAPHKARRPCRIWAVWGIPCS